MDKNQSKISIIIPVFNEEQTLAKNAEFYSELGKNAELIFVDGNSLDHTAAQAAQYGTVLSSPKGRANQMNCGAKAAKHDVLMFLHADTYFDINSLNKITRLVHQQGYIGGCLRQVIAKPGLLFKWIAFTGNTRARCSNIFYGDQGIFVRKDIFERLGGFPNVDIGEDVLFSKLLRKQGKVKMFSNPIYTSARRWEKQGVLKTWFINLKITLGLMFDKDPRHLAQLYDDIR